MKTRISKAYRGSEHVGWKKTVAGREWFLGYGTSPAQETRAIALAEVLEAKWRLVKVSGGSELSQTDYDDAKELLDGRPQWSSARNATKGREPQASVRLAPPLLPPAALTATPVPVVEFAQPAIPQRRWLHASIDEFVLVTKRLLKPDGSNGDHVFSLVANIRRSREAIEDIPLDVLRRKELDDWLLCIRALRSKQSGKPLSATTVRNLVAAVRVAMTRFAEWEWWTGPVLWQGAFRGYSVKKLETPTDRKRRRSRPKIFSVDEKRVLWHLALAFTRAMMALADWAGHTQKEIATLTFDEIQEENGEMYIARDRHKTGVYGRWWIPPEAAAVIRKVVSQTPRDSLINPNGLAFLTSANQPLVHRAQSGSHSRSDYVGQLWDSLLRAARHHAVKHISFKGYRKATAQQIRDRWGKEVSRTFLAQADEDVQDEHYTRASCEKVEIAARELYAQNKEMFTRITAGDWDDVGRRIRDANGVAPEDEHDEAV